MGSLAAYKRSPVRFLLDTQAAYGDVARFRLGPYLTQLVTHPDGISHVIAANDRNYCRGRYYEKFKIFFGQGLLTLDGDAWRSHRRVAQPAFLRTVIGQSTGHVSAATESMLQRWERMAAQGEPAELIPEVMALTLSSLSRTLFGLDVSDRHETIGQAVDFGVKAMFNNGTVDEMLPSWLPTQRNRLIRRHRGVLTDMVDRIRREHDREHATIDLVDLFESATHLASDHPWSDREIADELTTVFLAGQETTAMSLCWTLAAIASHPQVREELEAEVDRVLGGAPVTEQSLADLRYTQMVIEESLRLYPPIWLYTRDALAADEVMGYAVPAGSSVLVSPLATHRRPDLWPSPETFDPSRFDPDHKRRRARFAYFPFGGGPRQCIGMHLALHELKIMVAMIASRFRLELDRPVEIGRPVLSLRPLHDVTVRLHARHGAGRSRHQVPA
jgi:cytochrome P450